MRRFVRSGTVLGTVAVLAALVLPSGAMAANTKKVLIGPDYNGPCGGENTASSSGFGFANINYAGGRIEVTVSLKGLAPDTEYFVRVIQGEADCYTADGSVTTNGKGNATLHVSEDVWAEDGPERSTGVQLAINRGSADGYPFYGSGRVEAP